MEELVKKKVIREQENITGEYRLLMQNLENHRIYFDENVLKKRLASMNGVVKKDWHSLINEASELDKPDSKKDVYLRLVTKYPYSWTA